MLRFTPTTTLVGSPPSPSELKSPQAVSAKSRADIESKLHDRRDTLETLLGTWYGKSGLVLLGIGLTLLIGSQLPRPIKRPEAFVSPREASSRTSTIGSRHRRPPNAPCLPCFRAHSPAHLSNARGHPVRRLVKVGGRDVVVSPIHRTHRRPSRKRAYYKSCPRGKGHMTMKSRTFSAFDLHVRLCAPSVHSCGKKISQNAGPLAQKSGAPGRTRTNTSVRKPDFEGRWTA